MTAGAVGLVAAYVALAVLLLSLNLRADWLWPVKAAAILVTAGFFVASFVAVQAMLGRPTEQAPPADFRLHAAMVREPDPRGDGRGAIYLWLTEVDDGSGGRGAAAPRAHVLPYSRRLHEAVVDALRGLDEGREVRGRRVQGERGAGDRSDQGLELYTTDSVRRLPAKPEARRRSGPRHSDGARDLSRLGGGGGGRPGRGRRRWPPRSRSATASRAARQGR